MSIAAIYEPVQQGMVDVEERLKAVGRSDLPWMAEPMSYILESGGKRVRPALTLLAGRAFHYDLNSLLPMAVAVELFHTATLVHDDAVDESQLRRGRPTVNSLWGKSVALLVGDYLFARSAQMVCQTGNIRVMELFAQALVDISSGQLKQFMGAFDWRQSRDDYYEQIRSKTASLFALAAESGAILGGAPEDAVGALRDYGNNLGMAFQRVDDILDFVGDEAELGKPVGSDLLQGTPTLPLILLVERHRDDSFLKEIWERDGEQEGVRRVVGMVRDSSIVDECYGIAAEFSDTAHRALERLPQEGSRRALCELAHYMLERRI